MRILLSNDDGILAPGLIALRQAVADMGKVTVVAPDSPQSAAGHSITLQHPLTVQRVHLPTGFPPAPAEGRPGGEFWGVSVDGRPADCVRLAIRNLMPARPDLVLSGINAGANVGINVFYSGTVAAAAEAAMCGIPAVAFSAAMTTGELDLPRIARLARWALDRLLRAGLAGGDLINVNIPALGPSLPRGVRVVPQSTAGLDDVYHRTVHADGRESFRLADEYDFTGPEQETDVAALAEGFITVTPLHVDMTRRERLADIAAGDWGRPPP